MLKNIFIALFFAIVLAGMSSCKNDLNLISDYKDTTIVYAILSVGDSEQHIRIHKAFLGPGDALTYAQIPDSFYYKDILSVRLERLQNGIISGIINCRRDTSTIVKDTGVFAQFPNILYTSEDNDSIYADSEYRCVIHNNQTGKDIIATTTIADQALVSSPTGPTVNFLQNPFLVQWYPVPDAKIYNVVMTFHYSEEVKLNPTQFYYRTIKWNMGTIITENISSNQIYSIPIYQDDFYVFVNNNIQEDSTYNRKAGRCDFTFITGNKDLYSYYTINNNTANLSQSQPTITNFYGAIGILASRNYKTIPDRQINAQSLDSLKSGRFTKHLGFI